MNANLLAALGAASHLGEIYFPFVTSQRAEFKILAFHRTLLWKMEKENRRSKVTSVAILVIIDRLKVLCYCWNEKT